MIKRQRQGFVMLEVLTALALFASVGTALVVAINELGNLAFEIRRERRLVRIIDSELRRVMSLPNLEEGKETKSLGEMGIEVETLIEPIEEMENKDGQPLQNMFLIRVSAVWWADGEWRDESAETWRYARLYRQ